MMDHRSDEQRARALQDLSALADGEADADALGAACARWRVDAELRASWHAYHVIGDVMRSDELARGAGRGADFVRALRGRMADEPVVLAPAATPAPVPGRRVAAWSWKAPAAVAAGFVAVAGVLVVTNGTPPLAGPSATLAQSLAEAPPHSVAADALRPAEPTLLVADSQLVRDAGLRRYLAAHKQFGGSSAIGVSSGFLRAATSQAPDR